ncbi:MAG: hypothetical protein QW727_03025 [Candidatus Pacearchaeota archaeon]
MGEREVIIEGIISSYERLREIDPRDILLTYIILTEGGIRYPNDPDIRNEFIDRFSKRKGCEDDSFDLAVLRNYCDALNRRVGVCERGIA